jgi:S-adenosylmethionine:tRNA ribosyltransferase-isomerase
VNFGKEARATIVRRDATGTAVRVESSESVVQLLREQGQMPLPPYIKRLPVEDDHRWYQTMFAEQEGAIAAPTAGLHFTPELLARLAEKPIRVAAVTLHVGPGTFKPVTAERVEDHHMEEEWFEIGVDSAKAIAETKEAGGRVVAVGTTVVRTLESAARTGGLVAASEGATRLFITPGYTFRVVDVLMTNFHLPRTTLVMLVSAFAGLEPIRHAYAEAVREQYRFYSYGDAMLIL